MVFAKVKVSDFCAVAEYRRAIPTGLVGGEVAFEFIDPVWDSSDKYVVFESGDFTKTDVLDGNTAIIPPEAVSNEMEGNTLKVGVYCVDVDKTKGIPTFWASLGKIRDAADPLVDPNANPSLPIWATIMAKVKVLEESGLEVNAESIEKAVKEYLEENPPVVNGVPAGGKAGQYLCKRSDDDYDVAWSDLVIPERYGLITYDQNKTITVT